MAINQVEGFFNDLRKYNTKESVLRRANQEVNYLNNQCGSIGSLKKYYTIYRNYLKINIKQERLVSGISLISLLLGVLRLNNEQQRAFMGNQKKEVSKSQGNLRKIYDVNGYIKVSTGLLSAVSVYERILGIAALTGRRVGEVACTAKFEPVQDNCFKALFTGQLKTKFRTDIKSYEIPLLHNYEIISKSLLSVQSAKPQFLNNPALFNPTASSKLSVLIKRHFSGIFEGEQKTKDLRSIYALLAFERFKEEESSEFVTVSINKFFANILGHSADDLITCGSYIDFCTASFKQ